MDLELLVVAVMESGRFKVEAGRSALRRVFRVKRILGRARGTYLQLYLHAALQF